jgi:hypothetical protein
LLLPLPGLESGPSNHYPRYISPKPRLLNFATGTMLRSYSGHAQS